MNKLVSAMMMVLFTVVTNSAFAADGPKKQNKTQKQAKTQKADSKKTAPRK